MEEGRGIAEIVCVQNHYNLAHREDDALIDSLAEDGIAYVPFFPLGGFSPLQSATLSEVAKLAQIRLYYSSNSPAYVRSHTALLSIIQALAYGVYSRDAEQYADRIKAFRLK